MRSNHPQVFACSLTCEKPRATGCTESRASRTEKRGPVHITKEKPAKVTEKE